MNLTKLIFCLILLTAASMRPASAQLSAPESVPFTLRASQILVSARVNGQGPYTFLIDSGAQCNAIDSKVAAALALPSSGAVDVAGYGESQKQDVPILGPAAIAVGKTILTGQTFMSLDLSNAGYDPALPIQGVLGEPLFAAYVVRIEHAHATLTLTADEDPSSTAPGAGLAIPLRFDRSGLPMVEATVGGANGLFEIDTGSSAGIVLFPDFAHENAAKIGQPSPPESSVAQPLGGITHAQSIPSANLQLGSFSATVSPIEVLSSPPYSADGQPEICGNIGESLLQSFTVTFDCKRKRLILQLPNSATTTASTKSGGTNSCPPPSRSSSTPNT